MPQLNVLPMSVTNNVEVIDESSTLTSTKSNEDFSKLIDQHLANNPQERDSAQLGLTKSTEKFHAQDMPKRIEKKPDNDNLESKDDESKTLSNDQQELAASGNNGQDSAVNGAEHQAMLASEQLMSFLYKADNTLVNDATILTKPVDRTLSAEQQALYETQLLLNASHLVADLSGVADALSTAQNSPNLVGNSAETKHLLSTASTQTSRDKGFAKLPVEPFTEGKREVEVEGAAKTAQVATNAKAVINAENAEVLTTKQNDTSVIAAVIATENHEKNNIKNQFKQVIVTTTPSNNTDFVEINHISKAYTTSADGVFKQEVTAKNALDVMTTQSNHIEKVAINTDSQLENIKSTGEQEGAELAQVKLLAQVKPLAQTQSYAENLQQNRQVNSNQTNVAAKNSTDVDSEQSDVNAELSETNEGNNTVAINQNAVKSRANEQSVAQVTNQNSVANRANVNTQTLNEQMDISEQEQNKAQGEKRAQESEQGLFSAKLQAQITDEVLVKDKAEKSVRTEFLTNASFTDVSSKYTQATQHLLEQQSFELINPVVATEVTASQKTNTQLHQETLAVFRKDFTEAVKDKVMLIISQKLQQFDITLDPPELGSMQIRVNLQNEQAVVSFIVQSQQTKEALEQNMPKLRDMLAEQGVDVGEANVEQQSQQSANENSDDAANFQHGEDIAQASDVVEHTLSANSINASVNAIDYYA